MLLPTIPRELLDFILRALNCLMIRIGSHILDLSSILVFWHFLWLNLRLSVTLFGISSLLRVIRSIIRPHGISVEYESIWIFILNTWYFLHFIWVASFIIEVHIHRRSRPRDMRAWCVGTRGLPQRSRGWSLHIQCASLIIIISSSDGWSSQGFWYDSLHRVMSRAWKRAWKSAQSLLGSRNEVQGLLL
jgi:hypothetical protein